MSLAGLKKQFNKANQLLSEKIGGAKGSVLDEEFVIMEQRVDAFNSYISAIVSKMEVFLRPDGPARMKVAATATFSKVRGQSKESKYPHPEFHVSEDFCKAGEGLEESHGEALRATGEAFLRLGEAKESLELAVMQNFVEPVHLVAKDLKEINHHRKKLQGRRLDYDCKKRKADKDASSFNQAELRVAQEKFEESKEITFQAMQNLLSQEAEHIAYLKALVEGLQEYHQSSVNALDELTSDLDRHLSEAENKPRSEYTPKRPSKTENGASGGLHKVGSGSAFSSPEYTQSSKDKEEEEGSAPAGDDNPFDELTSPPVAAAAKPSALALYDFEPENEGELGFSEGDTIELVRQIDDNWLEGRVRGQTGYFPCTYVDVKVPL